MPIKRCTLPNGQLGWKWGDKGKCYSSRAAAVRQAQAAYAHGYREPVKKFNPYHDKLGRFTTADGNVIDPANLVDQLGGYQTYTLHKDWDSQASLAAKKDGVSALGLPVLEEGWTAPFSFFDRDFPSISPDAQNMLLDAVGSELLRMRDEFGLFKEGRPPQYSGKLVMKTPTSYGGTHRTYTTDPKVSEIYVNGLEGNTLNNILSIEKSTLEKHGSYFSVAALSSQRRDLQGLMASIFRHELGHSIHYAMAKTQTVGRNLHRKMNAYVRKFLADRGGDKKLTLKDLAKQIGVYATSSRREMAAEVFSYYTSPNYKKGTMDRGLEEVAEMMLDYASKQNTKEEIPPNAYRKNFFPILTPEQVDAMVEKLQEEGPFAYEEDLTEIEDEEFK